MRPTVILMAVLLPCFAADVHAQYGLPSPAVIDEMGLSGIQIMCDCEASMIRLSGYPPSRWGNLYNYVHGVSRLDRGLPILRRTDFVRLPIVARW